MLFLSKISLVKVIFSFIKVNPFCMSLSFILNILYNHKAFICIKIYFIIFMQPLVEGWHLDLELDLSHSQVSIKLSKSYIYLQVRPNFDLVI